MLPLRIVVRTQADWANMDRARFESQKDPTLPLVFIRSALKRHVLQVWDEAFRFGFFDYRARLEAIASQSLHAVAGALITTGLADLETWLFSPGEEIVVPTDDDDFFQPALAKVTAEFDERTNIVIWPSLHMSFASDTGKRILQSFRFKVFGPNNCALRKSYLARFSLEQVREMLANHRRANNTMATDLAVTDEQQDIVGLRILEHSSVQLLHEHFSLYNNHVGSVSFLLQQALRATDPLEFLRRLDLTSPVELPDYAVAFSPYVRKFEDLMGQILRTR